MVRTWTNIEIRCRIANLALQSINPSLIGQPILACTFSEPSSG
jgi:hypothetical protein